MMETWKLPELYQCHHLVAKGEIGYKDLEIALGGKISGTIAEMSDEDFQKSKIKLVKDEEENKKSGGGSGTAKEEDK